MLVGTAEQGELLNKKSFLFLVISFFRNAWLSCWEISRLHSGKTFFADKKAAKLTGF